MPTSEAPQAAPQLVNGVPFKPGAWDAHEDELLASWQKKVGNRWSLVAKHIPGRTGQQCAQRWRHRVNPDIKKEKWSAEEDRTLLRLVHQHGSAWAEISRGLEARACPGRTDQQCMGRWRRHLDPKVKRDAWSPQEDARLADLVGHYGGQWSRICRHVKSRTAQQCRARWYQLETTAKGGVPKRVPRPPRSPSAPQQQQQLQQQRRRKPKRSAWESGDDDGSGGGGSDGSDEASGERYEPPTLRSRRPQRTGGKAGASPDPTPAESASPRRELQLTEAGRALLERRSARAVEGDATQSARCDAASGPSDGDGSSPAAASQGPRALLSTRGIGGWPYGDEPPAGIRAHPLLWKPPADAETCQRQQRLENGGFRLPSTAGQGAAVAAFSTPKKAVSCCQDARSMASMQSAHTAIARDRRSSMLTTSTVNAPSAAADTPGGSSLSAVTGASPPVAERRCAVPAVLAADKLRGQDAARPASTLLDTRAPQDDDARVPRVDIARANHFCEPVGAQLPVVPLRATRSPISPGSKGKGPPKEKSLYDINKRAAPAAPLFSPSSARLPAAAPPSDEKTLVTTSQEHRTKETLFATPERRAPEASGSGAAADARRLRKRQSPQSGAAEPVVRSGAGDSSGGRSQTERESGVSPPDSAWRSSPASGVLGALLRSPELPGDPLQDPGSDFRTAVQNLVTPDWAHGKAGAPCSRCASECACGRQTASVQDERQLRMSRQLASSRQAKPSVARRLLVDAHADVVLADDERAAVESPIKKRRGDLTAADAPTRCVMADPAHGLHKGPPPPLLPPSAYTVPRGRVFAVNGLHIAQTDLAHAPELLGPAASVHGGAGTDAQPASLGSTYVRQRLDALLSSI